MELSKSKNGTIFSWLTRGHLYNRGAEDALIHQCLGRGGMQVDDI